MIGFTGFVRILRFYKPYDGFVEASKGFRNVHVLVRNLHVLNRV